MFGTWGCSLSSPPAAAAAAELPPLDVHRVFTFATPIAVEVAALASTASGAAAGSVAASSPVGPGGPPFGAWAGPRTLPPRRGSSPPKTGAPRPRWPRWSSRSATRSGSPRRAARRRELGAAVRIVPVDAHLSQRRVLAMLPVADAHRVVGAAVGVTRPASAAHPAAVGRAHAFFFGVAAPSGAAGAPRPLSGGMRAMVLRRSSTRRVACLAFALGCGCLYVRLHRLLFTLSLEQETCVASAWRSILKMLCPTSASAQTRSADRNPPKTKTPTSLGRWRYESLGQRV